MLILLQMNDLPAAPQDSVYLLSAPYSLFANQITLIKTWWISIHFSFYIQKT